jgi:hypothetical protein
MLKVVSKKVTAQKCPNMVFGLRIRMVLVGMFPHVRQVSPEKE